MACRVRDCRAAPSRRNRADSGASAAAPAVHSVAADGRLRVRSASRPLHSQSLSLVGTLSDSSSPSLEGDRVSLQLWGDIILEHLQFFALAAFAATLDRCSLVMVFMRRFPPI